MSEHVEKDVPRDSQGRDARIHGLVLNESNPAPTLRELLRQWYCFGQVLPAGGDLAERTRMVLEAIGPDGTSPTPPASTDETGADR